MKGAKGGNRDRIISWLFSEKNRKKREEQLELEKKEETSLDEKQKQQRKGVKITVELHPEEKEPKDLVVPHFIQDLVEEKEVNPKGKKNKATFLEEVELKEEIKPKEESGLNVSENNLEKPELIKISIIEELDKIICNDAHELRDIKYQIEVLQQQEKNEVLLENVEKIQKELEELIKKFENIKKKYSNLYGDISLKDIAFINELSLGNLIRDYLENSKDNIDTSKTINQIYEIKEFIEIINNIIIIEKQKDNVSLEVEEKKEEFGIRDEQFIKMQDKYANVDLINNKVQQYNISITSLLLDIEVKIANSLEVNKRIETTKSIVPNLNKVMEATIIMATTNLIPPTPLGNLFKATLVASAAHMMVNAFLPKTEEKEIVTTTVIDYSNNIKIGKDTISSVLDNIDNAFSEINYMKEMFENEFQQYAKDIPEYDTLIQNIFKMEAELTRQRDIAYSYDYKLDKALDKNNQKIKRYDES